MLAVHPIDWPALVAPADRHRCFVALLPGIEARGLRCPHDRDDAVAEVVARAWERFDDAPVPSSGAAARLADPVVAEVRSERARAARDS